MAMGKTVPLAINCIAIVICVIEEPVGDATCADADSFENHDLYEAVSPDEGKPKEVIAEFMAKLTAHESEFAEPDHGRIRRRSLGQCGDALTLVPVAVGESFEQAPEGGANNVKHICNSRIRTIVAGEQIDFEYSAVERVPIPCRVVE